MLCNPGPGGCIRGEISLIGSGDIPSRSRRLRRSSISARLAALKSPEPSCAVPGSAATNLSSSGDVCTDVLKTPKRPSIFLLVRSLEIGGAERQLSQLALGLQKRRHPVQIGVFYHRGPLASELARAQIPVFDLAKRGRWDLIGFLFRLRRVL